MQPIQRRRFLALTVISAGGLFGTVACSSDASPALSELDATSVFPQSIASGDPRPTSVVLWARAVDQRRPATDDLTLTLELAEDAEFTKIVSLDGAASRELTAAASADHCVKTRVEGLAPGTFYYYRFTYSGAGGKATSRIARTKTAPSEDADVPVRFAVVSCQDYAGKYYHAYRHLAAQDIDVIIHLGDYIYETTADPSFQVNSPDRLVTFSAPSEALNLGSTDAPYQAAQSLGNYRDLYRLYRSDPALQAAHELFPMIATQDDHEFSDDCHGDVATYTDGLQDETEEPRRLAADQAWFEYMPVDYAAPPTQTLDGSKAFPDQLTYYRSFTFGQHFELVLTDLRRYRPDHLVPEDAFPGSVFLTEPELQSLYGSVSATAVPYVDIDSYQGGAYRDALTAGADTLGIRASAVQGLLSVPFINDSLTTLALKTPAPIDDTLTSLKRGFAYHQLLKSQEFSRVGSRYLVALEPFNALADAKFKASNGASEQLMGADQRAWFLETMKASTRTFKIWGSEVAFMPRHLDLRQLTFVPEQLQIELTVSAEDWDGFPNERAALLAELAPLGNVVILAGDLHCFFAGTPYQPADQKQRLVEFVTGSLTSTTWQDGINSLAKTNTSLPPSAAFLAASIGDLLADTTARPNPHLAYQNLAENGYAIFEANGGKLAASLFSVPSKTIATAPEALSGDVVSLFKRQDFEVRAGAPDLYRINKGAAERWDIDSMSWVAS